MMQYDLYMNPLKCKNIEVYITASKKIIDGMPNTPLRDYILKEMFS